VVEETIPVVITVEVVGRNDEEMRGS